MIMMMMMMMMMIVQTGFLSLISQGPQPSSLDFQVSWGTRLVLDGFAKAKNYDDRTVVTQPSL